MDEALEGIWRLLGGLGCPLRGKKRDRSIWHLQYVAISFHKNSDPISGNREALLVTVMVAMSP